MKSVIQFEGVTKKFRGQIALDDVSFGVPTGSVFALLGENGAGKTTGLRILLGLMDADAGSTSILGMDGATQGIQIRRSVGYVPEQPDLYDWMTVREIGWFAAGFHGEGYWPGFQTLVDGFRVPPEKKIRSLSKGMRAKVSLSLALAHDPDVLILDEPTSGLDAIVRREFMESMVDRAALGKTVFLSSHQINEVERVADYVAIVREGKLLTVEKLDDLKADTRHVMLALKDATSEMPEIPGVVLESREQGRQYEAILRGAQDAELNQLREHPLVEAAEIGMPNLEEIFVAYMAKKNGEAQT